MKNNILLLLFFITISSSLNAQGLLEQLDKEYPKNKPVYEIATFKTTRIALGQSIETRKKGSLEISLYNRFWDIPNSTSQKFLADNISTRFILGYSITDKLTLGLGYTNFDEILDGYFKYKLIRQQRNSKKSPISVTLFQGISYRNKKLGNITPYVTASDKYAFTTQLLIAKKFNSKFSAQLSPTFIRRAPSILEEDPNNQFALGLSARHKISRHASIISEYYYVANPLKSINTYNAFTVGVNWELSHLLLQFHITNARSFTEDTFITQTTKNFNFKDGNFHFGFNASFVLHTKKRKIK